MKKDTYVILEAELLRQKEIIVNLFTSIVDLQPDNSLSKEQIESLGYRLHNLYCAWEDLFLIIARHFENNIEDKSRFHAELLKRMTLDIAGVRPHLLDEQTFRTLDELQSFRHVFRHAYGIEPDIRKLRIITSDIELNFDTSVRHIDDFLANVQKQIHTS